MAKILIAVVFSILLLIPLGVQNAFATHPQFTCPLPFGDLNTDPALTFQGTSNFCFAGPGFAVFPPCISPYSSENVLGSTINPLCVALAIDGSLPASACQNLAVLDANNHCVPDLNQICSTGTIIEPTQMLTCIAQSMGSMIGGALLEINTVSLLVGAIGTNPVITGLVGITLAGVAGQVAWFVHRRRKSEHS